jgi:hypothetical protein
MVLFFAINGIATVINALPLWIARYVLDLSEPEVSRLVQEVSDLLSGIIAGTALAMAFRLWAHRRWVFPGRPPDSRVRPGPSALLPPVEGTDGEIGTCVPPGTPPSGPARVPEEIP